MLPLDVNGDGKQELICAAESAHVFAISGEGKILWRTALPDGCADLAIDKSGKEARIVVSCGAAGIAVLSPAGKVTAQYPLAARAGSLVLLGIYLLLLFRIVTIAERQRSVFSRCYAYGVAAVFFFHIGINIAMTIGLAPVIGIPLPFISYGGTSLLTNTILLFILVRLDADRQMVLR